MQRIRTEPGRRCDRHQPPTPPRIWQIHSFLACRAPLRKNRVTQSSTGAGWGLCGPWSICLYNAQPSVDAQDVAQRQRGPGNNNRSTRTHTNGSRGHARGGRAHQACTRTTPGHCYGSRRRPPGRLAFRPRCPQRGLAQRRRRAFLGSS